MFDCFLNFDVSGKKVRIITIFWKNDKKIRLFIRQIVLIVLLV